MTKQVRRSVGPYSTIYPTITVLEGWLNLQRLKTAMEMSRQCGVTSELACLGPELNPFTDARTT